MAKTEAQKKAQKKYDAKAKRLEIKIFFSEQEKKKNNKKEQMGMLNEEELEGKLMDFYKENPNDKVWWTGRIGVSGEILFSFDKKKIYNIFLDYPHNLTKEEKEIFDKENPFWRDFFANKE